MSSPEGDKVSLCQDLSNARKPLARLRCLKECLECLKNNKPLPKALCFVPAVIEYVFMKNVTITVYASPSKDSKKLADVLCTTEHRLFVSGEELFTADGQWGKLLKVVRGSKTIDTGDESVARWILLFTRDALAVECLKQVQSPSTISATKETLFGSRPRYMFRWEEIVEHEYGLRLSKICRPAEPNNEVIEALSVSPASWTQVHYEQMSKLLGKHGAGTVETSGVKLGAVKEYVESIEVSSFSEDEDDRNHLTDADPSTYWESDGAMGSHWIKLKMKPGTVVRKLMLVLDSNDDNYIPSRVIVMGGTTSSLSKLSDVTIDSDFEGTHDAVILSEQSEHLDVIEIRIKECKDGGIDTRIRGIKIVSSLEKEMGFCRDLLTVKETLAEFPLLEGFDIDVLYRKAIVTQRLMKVLDSVLPLLVPRWEYSLSPFASLETARELLSLSKKRFHLVEHFLRETETTAPSTTKKVHIDRRAAMEHRSDPAIDPEYRKSVFSQLYEALKPREVGQKPLDYRWPVRYSQWWECKFLGEGIIDQGGGFRDSISDLSEELCPSSSDSALPLPFFIRSPNQRNEDASNFRDRYIANPSCTEFHKFEWIGKLMGACFRGKENLVLSLPPFIWKMILDRPVSWNEDYVTVDEAKVKMINALRSLNEDDYNKHFGSDLTWSVFLSNGSVFNLQPVTATGDSSTYVSYDSRTEFARLVEEARMNESKQQVQAIRNGFLQVVPEAALELFTWYEVEKRVCGDPDIPFETLRKHIMLESLNKDDPRVQLLFEVLEKFNVEDRSHFLRFVTGRRRLPATVHLVGQDGVDLLPTSSTCGSALFLPRYTSVKVMEEKLRYAIYNCVAIDTDTTATYGYDSSY